MRRNKNRKFNFVVVISFIFALMLSVYSIYFEAYGNPGPGSTITVSSAITEKNMDLDCNLQFLYHFEEKCREFIANQAKEQKYSMRTVTRRVFFGGIIAAVMAMLIFSLEHSRRDFFALCFYQSIQILVHYIHRQDGKKEEAHLCFLN